MTRLGEDREAFMARVRAALGRERPSAPAESAPRVIDETARLSPPAESSTLADLFAARASAVGMRISRTAMHDLAAHLSGLLSTLSARAVTMSIAPGPLATVARTALEASDRRIIPDPGVHSLDHHYGADVGITDVAAAIAETGSLVLTSGPGLSRGTFLIPPAHIALVRSSQILPDLVDYWPAFSANPALTVLITGPSKTADIEGVLVTGIHGPREVHIVLIAD